MRRAPFGRGERGEGNIKIDRHKAAIHRPDLSKPVRLALEAGLFTEHTTFFDYGCGHGEDIKRISDRGFTSTGWDPYYRPTGDRTSAEIVNLGYIINVIESQIERREALIKAWELAQKVLIVSAQVLIGDVGKGQIAYSDGVVSSRNTFQKYYEQEELKLYYVLSNYPQYEKFAKLTKQEESWGLLENMKDISCWQGWQEKLKEHCVELQGHRLVWLKDADSEAIKLLKVKRKGKKIQ